ncbi:SPFH domain-containing protein [Roseiterribacter gracilis]|uniref:Band 7 domain-containing protein n=1 Tax=Roseiterribacter gracilis TaxID=2812848 RepID=A0A8S8XH33_9PROT|nr:hypothetical protein TMPK1_40910 [Rhodospirillales bacterium TMPK1]
MSFMLEHAPAAAEAARRHGLRVVAGCVLAGVVISAAAGSYFVVQPTEQAGVRRFGNVISAAPVGPGLHWKAPFIDHVDKVQTSLNSVLVDRLVVHTIDNQPVTLAVAVSYTVPRDAVFHLLYEIGRAGVHDIDENLSRIVRDRASKVFAQQNTTTISESRQRLSDLLRTTLSHDLRQLYGVEVADLQIASITYSDSFRASVEAAVKAKNDAIAAENTVTRVRYEGEQRKVQAQADAVARVTEAEAAQKVRVLGAEAEAKQIELRGAAEAKSLEVVGQALARNPSLVSYTVAKAYKGDVPQVVGAGGQGGIGTYLLGQLPAVAAK